MKIEGVDKLIFVERGRRSAVYSGIFKSKKVAVKIRKKESKANTIDKEFNVLLKINKYGIGPKVFHKGKNYFVMEFIKGKRIIDFLKNAKREDILDILFKTLEKLHKLDEIGLNKEELTNPYKHIIVQKDNAVRLIDFDRARYVEKTTNITQFCSFLLRKNIFNILLQKKIFISPERLKNLCIDYMHKRRNYSAILSLILQRDFTSRVYFIVSNVPYGKVISYKMIGDKVNSKAYRMIGKVMNDNEFWPYVPCHRVVNNDGTIGGFVHGIKKKKELLIKEGIDVKRLKEYF